ncbi:pirin family protein [Desulfosarcina sp.]|uniref:pirin family protein n=1 Tax=Desulfosarcina sp. TaxID=2027861 RepID=UPI0029B5E0F3|nr:pirin family protein [Desulfosarcina sp.]MDX2453404.1 pirin family protein [Desulfosarcina sp.]MDX2491121.1 pirin family protein [Desulfosarcina sp.]
MSTTIIPADQRHFTDMGWLQTYWLFSFSNYYDPANMGHGKLRVFNDDVVRPGAGFPTHPHEEMEIITIVLKGEISHKDSMGNGGVIRAGEVQRMSAGTGLTHSEYNEADRDLHFFQVWILPDEAGLRPSYEQKEFTEDDFKNVLFPLASGQNHARAVNFNTDATIYRSRLDARQLLEHRTSPDRKLFVYLTSGRLQVNGEALAAKDQARLDGIDRLELKADQDADFILIDVSDK